MRHLLRSRKGIGLTEAIVAMAIIVTVSVAAMGIVTRFATNTADSLNQNEAITIVDNALECFKYCNSQSEFYAQVFRTMGVLDWPDPDGTVYTYKGIVGYIVVVKVTYTYGPHMAQFMAYVRKESNNRTVYSIPGYVKRVEA